MEEETIVEDTVDTTVDTTETTDSPNGEVAPQGETPEAKIARLEATNKQLYARLKKPAKPTVVAQPNKTNSDFFEERIELIAAGENKDIVSEAAILAKAKGITLSKAMEDPLIVAFKEKKAADKRSEDASLGASGKSATATEEKFKPGMTREEHKKAWMEANAK